MFETILEAICFEYSDFERLSLKNESRTRLELLINQNHNKFLMQWVKST